MTQLRLLKTCFKCGSDKLICDFYPHPKMSDWHLNKCKDCARADAAAHSKLHPEIDRRRNSKPHRVAARREYFQTARGKTVKAKINRSHQEKYPEKYKARTAAGNARRSGDLVRRPCEVCGDPKSEGHHPDYSRPLDVIWLCNQHHRDAHGGFRK